MKIGNRGLRLIREGVLPGVMTVPPSAQARVAFTRHPRLQGEGRLAGCTCAARFTSRERPSSLFDFQRSLLRAGGARQTRRRTGTLVSLGLSLPLECSPSSLRVPRSLRSLAGLCGIPAQIFRAEARPATPSAVSPPRRVVSSYVFDRKPLKEYCLSLREDVAARPRTSHGISTKQRKIAIDWLGPKTSGLFAGGYGGVPRKP